MSSESLMQSHMQRPYLFASELTKEWSPPPAKPSMSLFHCNANVLLLLLQHRVDHGDAAVAVGVVLQQAVVFTCVLYYSCGPA